MDQERIKAMRKLTIIALGLLLSINSMAQGTRRSTGSAAALRVKSSAPKQSVDALLEKYLKAIGGREAIESPRTVLALGSQRMSEAR